MSRKWNFSAGPATLPEAVLDILQNEIKEYRGSGMSLIEASHRGKEYDQVHSEAVARVKELLGLSDDFQVLFLGGGATLQFAMVPMNLLIGDGLADYAVSGAWAKKAFADAGKLGDVKAVFDGAGEGYASLPEKISCRPGSSYLHITSNETIGGLEWKDFPDTGDVPLVADMSSDIMSRRLPVERFGLIYAGAQKNLGPAGTTLVILRKDLLGRCKESLPAYLNYSIHAEKNSLYNTPPVFSIWAVKLVLDWVKEQGGLPAMEDLNRRKAGEIYGVIDKSGGFYRSPVDERYRSLMNIVFRLPTEELEAAFIKEAAGQGLAGLKGHRSVGGCRASVYNAMPLAGAEALAGFMKDFARKNG